MNIICSVVVREHHKAHTQLSSQAKTKQAIFLLNILWESCSKFDFKQCSFKKFLKILIFQRENMYFHGKRHPLSTNHPFISLYTKYQSHRFICLPRISKSRRHLLYLSLLRKQKLFVKKANIITLKNLILVVIWFLQLKPFGNGRQKE